MDQHVKKKLAQAEEHLSKAKNELCKPEEDVVPYSVCQNAYNSVVHYLSGFLMHHNQPVPEEIKIEHLLRNCRTLDSQFKELHLAPLYNPTQSEDVWMNMDTAKDYLMMAEKTGQLVQNTI
jgi:HEPN domain-containing protein